jgi:hypothetical protein
VLLVLPQLIELLFGQLDFAAECHACESAGPRDRRSHR